MTNPQPTLENLTDLLQRFLGIQQAQTFTPDNATADAIARLTGTRGDITRILALWREELSTAGRDLVEGYESSHHDPVLIALRTILDVSLAAMHQGNGRVRALIPLAPILVTHKEPGTVYRDVGRTVVEGLWDGDTFSDVRTRITTAVNRWQVAHPVARVLTPLAVSKMVPQAREVANMARALKEHPGLLAWRDVTVLQDWTAWLQFAPHLSIDEQLESMTSLICLHLHMALLHLLALRRDGERLTPLFFLAVEGDERDPVAKRGAYATYSFWRDRPEQSLALVAHEAVNRVAEKFPDLAATLDAAPGVMAAAWAMIQFDGTQTARRREEYRVRLEQSLASAPAGTNVRDLVVATLVEVFGRTKGSVTDKTKQYLRTTGMGAGIVGPTSGKTWKRYRLDERGLTLLARLHATRPLDAIMSVEEDGRSVPAFLDDVFSRYGIIITDEREVVQHARQDAKECDRALWRLMPNADAMRQNRNRLDTKLDALRLVRRYSDASAVIHIAGARA